MGMPALPPGRGQGLCLEPASRIFFYFSVFFLLFGPLGRGDPRPAAWPGPGLMSGAGFAYFFILVYFSNFSCPSAAGIPGLPPGRGQGLCLEPASRIFSL